MADDNMFKFPLPVSGIRSIIHPSAGFGNPPEA